MVGNGAAVLCGCRLFVSRKSMMEYGRDCLVRKAMHSSRMLLTLSFAQSEHVSSRRVLLSVSYRMGRVAAFAFSHPEIVDTLLGDLNSATTAFGPITTSL